MSNKKETPVRWLVEEIAEKFNFRFASFYGQEIQHALQMEALNQQKYDEMLEMLSEIVRICDLDYIRIYQDNYSDWQLQFDESITKAEQLVKEAKEL
jgi:hypothetical protein